MIKKTQGHNLINKGFKGTAELGEHLILMGACSYYGLINSYIHNNNLILKENVKKKHIFNKYISIPNYNTTDYILKTSDGFYIPTEARCIVDCIKYKNIYFSTAQFLSAVNNYFKANGTLDELYEVADFFKVSRADIDQWVIEADNLNYK